METLLESAGQTEELGAKLAPWLRSRPGAVVYLQGPLGSGKTTLARGLLRELGVDGPIRSPTYTLMEPYDIGVRRLIHLDLYRLRSPIEVEQLGLQDYPPDQSWWLVEWPERGGAVLPPADLSIVLAPEGNGRKAKIQGWP